MGLDGGTLCRGASWAPEPCQPWALPQDFAHLYPLSASSQLGEGQLLLFRSEGCHLFEDVGGSVNETSSEINFGVMHACFACLGK